MGAPAKFLFETDFSPGAKSTNTVPLAEHKIRVGEAETRGYTNGFATAQAEAQAENARRLSVALERITAGLGEVVQGFAGVEARLEAEAVDVAVAVARKLVPELIAREPFAEIAALVTDCLRQLSAAPHVVVRVGEMIYPAARERLDAIARDIGFSGRLVVMTEPGMKDDDCRIEWADGGIARDRTAIEAVIADTVARYLTVRRDAAHIERTGG
jgi:flagellar assembly protein FliH